MAAAAARGAWETPTVRDPGSASKKQASGGGKNPKPPGNVQAGRTLRLVWCGGAPAFSASPGLCLLVPRLRSGRRATGKINKREAQTQQVSAETGPAPLHPRAGPRGRVVPHAERAAGGAAPPRCWHAPRPPPAPHCPSSVTLLLTAADPSPFHL